MRVILVSSAFTQRAPGGVDIHAIETSFVEEDDKIVNPLGVKGMGELGMVGIPAVIANAVFHATVSASGFPPDGEAISASLPNPAASQSSALH